MHFYQEMQLAPPEEFVRYMAIFRRSFRAIHTYSIQQNIAGMLLGGELTDALHTVPIMLWHYSPKMPQYSPLAIESWLNRFPIVLRKSGATEAIVQECMKILDRAGGAQELGLNERLDNYDPAPKGKMEIYLQMLHQACLQMRHRHYVTTSWDALDPDIITEVTYNGAWNGWLARALMDLPVGLVRWRKFNERAFCKHAMDMAVHLPEGYADYWEQFFDTQS
jgi:hypothetical protein